MGLGWLNVLLSAFSPESCVDILSCLNARLSRALMTRARRGWSWQEKVLHDQASCVSERSHMSKPYSSLTHLPKNASCIPGSQQSLVPPPSWSLTIVSCLDDTHERRSGLHSQHDCQPDLRPLIKGLSRISSCSSPRITFSSLSYHEPTTRPFPSARSTSSAAISGFWTRM